ncbi:hypothetical protein Tsubulata_005661 [Turnera subulata]|uniref:Protein kinase domain-containing protein n=1 Tax=Turnera subulata TaxID=218843 RepID=A0A9Q0J0I7_9ROSI|nr:hypothetical protein Tsubulata_005661 [Turnera subulata]
MEQFRQVGEVLGSLKALMILQDDTLINKNQCCLLLDAFSSAFATIAEEIKENLKLEERNNKWKPLEEPLREIYRVFKEGELYVKRCLDSKDWWGKAICLHQNKDAIEFHIHNLLSTFPAVIEAIETAGEISGLDQEVMQKRRVMLAKKYDRGWNDPKLFLWRFGKQYLVTQQIWSQIENAVKEDGWLLADAIKQKRKTGSLTKTEQRLAELLLKKLNGVNSVNGKLPLSSILTGAEDYQLRRRLGGGTQYKEIHWLGENFALRQFSGDIEALGPEINKLLALSHPNIVQFLSGFYDEEKKELFLLMDLMTKDLHSQIKENSSPRRRVLLPIPIMVDIMLQIARGMEFLHSQKVYAGELNPTNVFLKPRKCTEGYFHVKVSGFGLTSVENHPAKHASPEHYEIDTHIWYAPEVLADLDQPGKTPALKYTEKADVYSFGMVCFELLSGKLPFEDGHLHGEQMIKNVRAGERPLFPSILPKCLVNLTKRCWHTDPNNRPSFSSICRVLRYIKKSLAMNPYIGQPSIPLPLSDYFDLEAAFLKKSLGELASDVPPVAEVPFQMFSYKLVEKEKTFSGIKFKNVDGSSDSPSNGNDSPVSAVEDPASPGDDPGCEPRKAVCFDMKSVCFERNIPSDLRSVMSEPPEKNIGKKPAAPAATGVKIRRTKTLGSLSKPKPPTPPKPMQTPRRKVPAWNSPANSLKISRENRTTFSISQSSPRRTRAPATSTRS